MKLLKRCSILTLSLILCAGVVGCSTTKDSVANFPNKNIEVIVPFSAGGGTDSVARSLVENASDEFDTTLSVVNKTGGGGAVGFTSGSKAKPDGYQVTLATVELTTLPHLGQSSFSSDDFTPILQVNTDPACIAVKSDSELNTIEDLVKLAKENPGTLKIGNSGVGAIWHLSAEAFAKKADIELNHVPYEGANPAIAGLLGGHVELIACSPGELSAQVAAGEIKILGIMADERIESQPEVPTFKEQGYDISMGTWRGLVVPKDTPEDVVAILEDGFTNAANKEEFKEFMETANLGYEVLDGETFGTKINENNETFSTLIKELGLSN